MKICFLNRLRSSHPGGDMIAMDATIAALKRRGVDAFFMEDFRDTLPEADVYHVMHCNFGWSEEMVAKVIGNPLVITPVFYPDESIGLTFGQIGTLLRRADVVLPFSYAELGEITWHCGMIPFKVIPNGTDPKFHLGNGYEYAKRRRGCEVITVHARKGDKNTDFVNSICEELNVDCYIANGISEINMPDSYGASQVFINCSTSERMSLSTGEALCAGCRVIDTTENRGNEWYPGIVQVCPWSKEAVKGTLEYALTCPTWDFRPNDAARILTWDFVADELIQVYRKVAA